MVAPESDEDDIDEEDLEFDEENEDLDIDSLVIFSVLIDPAQNPLFLSVQEGQARPPTEVGGVDQPHELHLCV